jgi:hypothetical protein
MVAKRTLTEDAAKKLMEEFLEAQDDVSTVREVEQRIQLNVVGTDAYVTSYTRQQWDKGFGGPVQAVKTRTNKKAKKVFIYPADDPEDKQARKLRCDDISGPAYFAFGVPLRELKIKLPEERRLILPMGTMEVEGQTVYWVSFADYEKENRKLGGASNAAASTGQKQVRRKKGEEPAPTDSPVKTNSNTSTTPAPTSVKG